MKDYTNFFTPLGNTRPYMKVAAHGIAGSGKTYTCARIAGGIYHLRKSTKPLVIFDTETSSKFLKPFFLEHKIPVLVKESRQLSDLITTMDFCEAGNADVLLIDSITHVWENYLEAFKAKKNRSFLQFQDWGTIKPYWKSQFSDRVVMGRYDIIFTGRQGDTYDTVEDENGKKELVKSGVKMKAETDTAYEPDLLLMMERCQEYDKDQNLVTYRQAQVLKDRSALIDGKIFRNPTFKDFKPCYDWLTTDVASPIQTVGGDDRDLVQSEHDNREAETQRQIVLERVWNILKKHAGGTAKADKARYFELLSLAFHGEQSETAIEKMNIMELQSGLDKLRLELEPIPEGNLI